MTSLSLPTESDERVATRHNPPLFALGREYWKFFAAAFFFDAGFAMYFFLFNLFLLDARWTERSISLIGGAFTLGSAAATLPAGEMVRRFGVRPVLLVCFVSAPILGIARTLWLAPGMQLICAILAGSAMSLWGVSYLPATARLTDSARRTSAYSLIFAASVLTSALGAVLCGFLPAWLARRGVVASPWHLKRALLILSCGVASLGLIPAARMQLRATTPPPGGAEIRWRHWELTPFLRRFLPCMALWTGLIAAFSSFSTVYLAHGRQLPLRSISLIFSAVQMLQLLLGVATAPLLELLGLRRGLLLIQLCAAFMLAILAVVHSQTLCISAYILFFATQWMSSPALYSTLMNETHVNMQSRSAALTLFLSALAAALVTPLAGTAFARFGYTLPLLCIAALVFATAVLLYHSVDRATPVQTPLRGCIQ